MPRDSIGDDAHDREDERGHSTRLKRFFGDLAVLVFGFLIVLALLAARLHMIWLPQE